MRLTGMTRLTRGFIYLVVLNALAGSALLAQRGQGGAGRALTPGAPLPSSTALGSGALSTFPSSTALASSPSLRSPGYKTGGYGRYGNRVNNTRQWRQLPFGYVAAPYYYPFYDYGGDYSGPAEGYNDNSGYGPDPATDAMLRNQAALGQQVQRLTAQLNDLMYGQGYPQPPGPPAAQQGPPAIPLTVILRDGKQMTVQNYAITGNMLWDFTGNGAARKIPLSTIDIPASTKATEAAGGEFPQLDGTR